MRFSNRQKLALSFAVMGLLPLAVFLGMPIDLWLLIVTPLLGLVVVWHVGRQ